MVKEPQYDNHQARGGADVFDAIQAGVVLLDDYFPVQDTGGGGSAVDKDFIARYRRMGRR